MTLELLWPYVFLLLPLPWLSYRYLPAIQQQNVAALKVPSLLPFSTGYSQSQGKGKQWFLTSLALLMWIGLLTALARPQWVGEPIEIPVSGRDLMMAVDLSGSMEVEDFQLNNDVIDRLSATKTIAGDFIDRRVGDRLGLILFGTKAYIQAPLTFDRKTVGILLEEAVIGLAGEATAIGDAIGLAVKRMKASQQKPDQPKPVLILLTDGANTAGEVEPIQAAELAAQEGLKIYTIGIGADEMLVRSLFGTQRINPSRDLDERTLKQIAQKSGGKYFRARNTQELENIYKKLDEMEPVVSDAFVFRPVTELFWWPLAVAAILALIILLALYGRDRVVR
jgi:Ca-activated chloride channel family protein